jgi:hypothetical protein
MQLLSYTTTDIVLVGLLFMWAGFVRSGLGFGGAALGLPLLLLIDNRPIIWLPIMGFHLLFFSALTLRTRIHNVNWNYLKSASVWVIPSTLVGVLGLITIPNTLLVIFIYGVTLFYAFIWLANIALHSEKNWIDKLLLLTGGYVAGTSLTGAPLMVAVFMRHVPVDQLRNTLFVLWFTLVTMKMSMFAVLQVELHFLSAAVLIPVAAIGHYLGLKSHDFILQNDVRFKRITGGVLILVCFIGLSKLYV